MLTPTSSATLSSSLSSLARCWGWMILLKKEEVKFLAKLLADSTKRRSDILDSWVNAGRKFLRSSLVESCKATDLSSKANSNFYQTLVVFVHKKTWFVNWNIFAIFCQMTIWDLLTRKLRGVYGSVSAGRGKCLFNVLFFLKVKPPCDQTW